MTNITGTVLDPRGIPLPGVTMILTGAGAAPVIQITGADGRFSYPAEAGFYKLTAVHGSFNYAADQSVVHNGTSNAVTDFAIHTKPAEAPGNGLLDRNKYLLLKYLQYIFLGLIGWYFFKQLIGNQIDFLNLDLLNEIEVARGAITYLVAVTTVAMAAILMLAAIMTGGKDLDKRFALGKEILTLLIGILGTIIGFYYGSSTERGMGNNEQNDADSIRVGRILLNPESPKANATFALDAVLTGGTAPYTYSVTFAPPITADTISNKQSKDGRIAETFTVPGTVKPNTPVRLVIRGKDSKNVPFASPNDKPYQFTVIE